MSERDGRFTTRLAVPADLRPYLDTPTHELRMPHGRDKRRALAQHPRALATFHDMLDEARRRKARAEGVEAAKAVRATAPMTAEEIARRHYLDRLDFDEELRGDHRYAQRLIDTDLVADLKEAIAGAATNDQLAGLVGSALERYRQRGNHDAVPGSTEWRKLARTVAVAELEALRRVAERDEGDFTGQADIAILQPVDEPEPVREPSVKFGDLVAGYFSELAASGRGAVAQRRWAPSFANFERFLKHDDASRITKTDVIRWKDELLTRYSPKTVRDSHLAAVKAVLAWGHDNAKIDSNPAQGVKVRLTPRPQAREKGFTDAEASAVLKAARDYMPKHSDNPQTRESPQMTAAKQWIPWICAFTGARVAEIAQLRKEDVREIDGIAFLRITPDVGSVKSGLYRDAPLHIQIIELGFLDFVAASGKGPLFYAVGHRKPGAVHPSKSVATRLGKWLRSLPAMPPEVDPSHGWRHRLKTVGRELGLDPRVIDAIQGHAARTAGENYGDVTLRARKLAIDKLPMIDVDANA